MGDSKVKVAVRVRPMNRREFDLHTKCVVDVDTNKVILHPVNTKLAKGDARSVPVSAPLQVLVHPCAFDWKISVAVITKLHSEVGAHWSPS
nr:kinesin-like protein KIF13B [Chelonoidis abingdonii]